MIEISPPEDSAVLVSAPRRGTPDDDNAQAHLDELARLADTAGARVLDCVLQRIGQRNSKFYIGTGKLEELNQRVKETGANLVIFDDELTPVQGKNLEKALDVRIMDRAEVILDIFANRARTNEAKMQVELAQLEYLLPRLARMWVHLSRIRGGIGLRGPGETQIETDRRMIRRKISKLKQKLEKVARHRELIRQGRRPIPTAALVGYTNAGKSSLLRALTKSSAFVEDRLFATLDTLTREVWLGHNMKARVIDTVGFIRKLPHDLVASFRATLEEAAEADVLLIVVDASQPDWEENVDVVEGVLAELVLDDRRVIHVFNKMDAVAHPEAFRERATALYRSAVFVSAVQGDVGELKARLADVAQVKPVER